ncbi:MAG: DegQ family serine endoprotease, partial [Pseudomonadota bacterium]|nr:DegQ family serine endoprotease [Pseudomonadota bacterium]
MNLISMTRIALLPLLVLTIGGAPAYAAKLPDFADLAEQQSAAVVNISTKQTVTRRAPAPFNMPQMPEGSPFEDFFRHFFGPDGQPEQRSFETQSLGSGFIVSADGYVLTNHHVVASADEIVVRLVDRREYLAELVGSDARSDIAVLKLEATDLPTVKIGSVDEVRVGEWVLAIGSPFGFDHSVTAGIVSATGRSLPKDSYVPFIQTDVAINPGNSGGPLFNMDGEVIGVNSQIYSRTGGFMGLSFAIPIDVAMEVVDQIKERGYVSRGWLGVLIQDVTRELAESFGMKQPRGALVAKVVPDSPADKAGIQVGDIILEFNDTEIVYSSDLPPLVGRSPVGTKSDVGILRSGKRRTVTVTIQELEEEVDESSRPARERSGGSEQMLGLVVSDLTEAQRD